MSEPQKHWSDIALAKGPPPGVTAERWCRQILNAKMAEELTGLIPMQDEGWEKVAVICMEEIIRLREIMTKNGLDPTPPPKEILGPKGFVTTSPASKQVDVPPIVRSDPNS